jgi:hypothetical protein
MKPILSPSQGIREYYREASKQGEGQKRGTAGKKRKRPGKKRVA